ncbi:MASE3 domain-containing protein [Bacillus sp. 31A1R]|uniref:histidine kinase n=1 Tax=Robertmurraya mangrovi TaxID=3098077 RepID=A0ABU5J2P2_9BACI|nr:MASE3 domain-containing protein [Bacillus sp. 31A1R]MDZ5473678.1 MASE3 domain-containing protein [Bacillus sp. 31A1R]
MFNLIKQNKFAFSLLFISVLLMGLGYIYKELMDQLYNRNNHVFVHTILELFSVVLCFAISLYGWKAYEDAKSKTFLYLPFIFLGIGILDLFHFMTYPGMPFFITEGSLEKTGWFWILARGTASIGLFYLTIPKKSPIIITNRKWVFTFTILMLSIMISMVYRFEKELPVLIINDFGPTILKNILEYLLSLLLLLALLNTLIKYRKTKRTSDLELVFAFSLLFFSEITLTIYHNISDLYVVIGHLIKAFGYSFILKAFFFSRLQLTFQQKLETEKDLKTTQVLLQSFFYHTPDSITIMDNQGKILKTNQGFERVYGWKEEEVIGQYFPDIMPDLRENIDYVLAEVSSGKNLIAYETTRHRKDGSRILINMTISPIKNDQGEVIQIAAISRDITLQKQAERKLLEMERELKETIRRQQGVTFKFIKREGQFIHTICDGELLYKLGLRPELIVGKSLDEHPVKEIAVALKNYYEQAWFGQEVTFELTLFQRVCVITLKPIMVEDEVIEVIGSCIDITQLKRTEELLQKSEKLAVVGELAAGLAHEIRNPLTTLKGFTQLIEYEQGRANREYIRLMLSELDRIEMITNEFMAVAKPQAVKYQEEDLISLVKQTVNFYIPQTLLKNIHINEDYNTKYSRIICDGNQLKQVFINLIKNAIEAMPKGGSLYISVQNTETNYLQVKIRDTGVGVSKEILPRLGEPFYTLKEKGTGLGLMVSYRIIESHQGTIQFESVENEGTTVIITLPILKPMLVK